MLRLDEVPVIRPFLTLSEALWLVAQRGSIRSSLAEVSTGEDDLIQALDRARKEPIRALRVNCAQPGRLTDCSKSLRGAEVEVVLHRTIVQPPRPVLFVHGLRSC